MKRAITSTDPLAYPAIRPNYLSDERDCAVAVGGIKVARRIAEAPSLAGRIVGVADSFETMTEIRSYKQPMSFAAAQQELVEPLSGRELEILALVAQGDSNKEIAAALFSLPFFALASTPTSNVVDESDFEAPVAV